MCAHLRYVETVCDEHFLTYKNNNDKVILKYIGLYIV